jgi:hypothetical protein
MFSLDILALDQSTLSTITCQHHLLARLSINLGYACLEIASTSAPLPHSAGLRLKGAFECIADNGAAMPGARR